jgi:prepilin-type N-terminal cleavage/methylation domain-containing protein
MELMCFKCKGVILMLKLNNKRSDKKFFNKYKKGLTLIEVVVSIAILGLMSISFLSMFSGGINWIFKSGNKSSAQYTSQEKIENIIYSESNADGINSSSNPLTIKLNFSGKEYNVSGRKIDVEASNNNQVAKYTTFTTE